MVARSQADKPTNTARSRRNGVATFVEKPHDPTGSAIDAAQIARFEKIAQMS
jgi:hypothetical protein